MWVCTDGTHVLICWLMSACQFLHWNKIPYIIAVLPVDILYSMYFALLITRWYRYYKQTQVFACVCFALFTHSYLKLAPSSNLLSITSTIPLVILYFFRKKISKWKMVQYHRKTNKASETNSPKRGTPFIWWIHSSWRLSVPFLSPVFLKVPTVTALLEMQRSEGAEEVKADSSAALKRCQQFALVCSLDDVQCSRI